MQLERMLPKAYTVDRPLTNFWSSYAYQMLLGLGYRIKQRMTQETFENFFIRSQLSDPQSLTHHWCYASTVAMYHRARRNAFFDINTEIDSPEEMPARNMLDQWVYVPRVYLTAYGVMPLPVKPIRSNRILRQQELFGSNDYFCRVIIRDVDLSAPQQDYMKLNARRWETQLSSLLFFSTR